MKTEHLIKLVVLACITVLFSACGHDAAYVAKPTNLAPIGEHIDKARTSTKYIKTELEKASVTGLKPKDPIFTDVIKVSDAQDLELIAAKSAIDQKQKEIDKNTLEANKEIADLRAENESLKASVKHRNLFLIVALFLGGAAFYGGTWAKVAYPPLVFVPNVLVGFGAVLVVAIVMSFILYLWSGFGWLFRWLT